ncbi:MAG: hypothetical protein J6R37_03740 [Clostridia bacterium]|nr:hypothetical protein [Clostridia bacterium]
MQKLATAKELFEKLDQIFSAKWDKQKKLSLFATEKALNKVCLTSPKTERQLRLFHEFDNFAYLFERVLSITKNKPLLPADKKQTRLEKICQTIATCTAFCLSSEQYQQIKLHCTNRNLLTQKEVGLFDTVYALEKCNYYAQSYFDQRNVAKLLSGLLPSQAQKNTHYTKCDFVFDNVAYGVDCLGESAVFSKGEHFLGLSQKVFLKKKNVLDTFDAVCFGKNTATFVAENENLSCQVQRVFQNGDFHNLSFQPKKDGEYEFVLNLSLPKHGVVSHFILHDAHCFCIQQKSATRYVGVMLLKENAQPSANVLQQRYVCDARICHKTTLAKDRKYSFSWAVVYADDVGLLGEKLADATRFGATKLWQGFDTLAKAKEFVYLPISKYNCSSLKEIVLPEAQRKFDFRLGEGNLALLVDSKKGIAPLLDGFVFGTGGVNLIFVDNFGNVANLLTSAQKVQDNFAFYSQSGVEVEIACQNSITMDAKSAKNGKLLFFVKFERLSKVKMENNVFYVNDGKRKYTIKIDGKIFGFTTNLLECSINKMRLKMSQNIEAGQGLCLCLSKEATITLQNQASTPFAVATPLLKESVLSTCLNYLNDKNAFELHHQLKKPDALTLSAICFTNQDFVYNYVKKHFTQNYVDTFESAYYNSVGQLSYTQDKMLLPLSAIYYTMLSGDKSLWTPAFESFCKNLFFFCDEQGQNLCVKALALKKYTEIFSKDKVRVLSLYAQIKERISLDKALYHFAQAIGAVPLENPTKENLKSLFLQYNAKGSFYYVSQLENLYGFSLVCDKLSFMPQSQDFQPESLSLVYKGKKFVTEFNKGENNKMVLNGITYFQGLDASQVKKANNYLTVQY